MSTPDQMLHILTQLDIDGFRTITGATDATDDEILESLHVARSECDGVPRQQKMDSKRFLYRRRH